MAKWAKGESGNPGGRPKGLGDIREIARAHTGEAIETLVKVMNKPEASASAQVAAAVALLDRGWGRPSQTINASIESNNQGDIDASLEREMSEIIKMSRSQSKPENARETVEEGSPPVPQGSTNTH